jgi:hypothetical protein
MYSALWRLLPGPLWLRVLMALAVVALVLVLLAYVIFPWVSDVFFTPDVTIEG